MNAAHKSVSQLGSPTTQALVAFSVLLGAGALGPIAAAQALEGPPSFVEAAKQPLSDFVRRIYQDGRGHYWFGTNGDGVLRWDGTALEGFSTPEGLGGVAVRGIVEDHRGNVWFGTNSGLTRYDGASFANFTKADGLVGNDVWALEPDRNGNLWIGTTEGVSRFDGEAFTAFSLPETQEDPSRGITSDRMVHCIMEDSRGRVWFATNGGAFVYEDGVLTNISEDDGLCDDVVNCIIEAQDGSLWFATHHNGVCRFDGTTFTSFGTDEGIEGREAWDLFEDSQGNIWFPMENAGVYRYDGTTFHLVDATQGLTSNAVQCTFEDADGRVWFGGHRGLFRLDGEQVVPVTRGGPWP